MGRLWYHLSGLCTCEKCGDVYRRIAWNNRGKKYTVWRCCTRVEHGPAGCDAPTIYEKMADEYWFLSGAGGYEMYRFSDEQYSCLSAERDEFWDVNKEQSAVYKLPCYAIYSVADGTVFSEVPSAYCTENNDIQTNTSLWHSMYFDSTYTERKTIITENDTFEEDFVSKYIDVVPEAQVLTDVSGIILREYKIDEISSVFVIEEPCDDWKIITCIYYNQENTSFYDDEVPLELDGTMPVDSDANYSYTV